MSEGMPTESDLDAIRLIRRRVQGQILDWATALEMNAAKDDPAIFVAKEMREWLRTL